MTIDKDLIADGGASATLQAADITITQGSGDDASKIDRNLVLSAANKTLHVINDTNGQIAVPGGNNRNLIFIGADANCGKIQLGQDASDNGGVAEKFVFKAHSTNGGYMEIKDQSAANAVKFQMGQTAGNVTTMGNSSLMTLVGDAAFSHGGATSTLTVSNGDLQVGGNFSAAATAEIVIDAADFKINVDQTANAGIDGTKFILGKSTDAAKGMQVMFVDGETIGGDASTKALRIQNANNSDKALANSGIQAQANMLFGSGAGLTNLVSSNVQNVTFVLNELTNNASDDQLDVGCNIINEGGNRAALGSVKTYKLPRTSASAPAVGSVVRICVANEVTETNHVLIQKHDNDNAGDVKIDGENTMKIQSPSGSVELVYLGSVSNGTDTKHRFSIL